MHISGVYFRCIMANYFAFLSYYCNVLHSWTCYISIMYNNNLHYIAYRVMCNGVLFLDWLPRLERLAALRGLDTFEVNVLLTLTGCMVSRNLRDSSMDTTVNPITFSLPLLT